MENIVHKNFVIMCESLLFADHMLNEDSTAMDQLRGSPGAEEIVRALHTQSELHHLQDYQVISKISWSDLKHTGDWVLFRGQTGTAALRADKEGYTVWASGSRASGEVVKKYYTRGGDVLTFMRDVIGRITATLVSRNIGDVRHKVSDIQAKRAAARKPTGKAMGQPASNQSLLLRFKPLLIRYVTAAEADMRGIVNSMIKSGAYRNAKPKIDRMEALHDINMALQSGQNSIYDEKLEKTIQSAVILAAGHYYPEETGQIQKSYGGFRSDNSEGTRKLLADIGSGDNKKLAAVMGFFQRMLVH